MIVSGSKFGLRLEGDKHITWYATQAAAEREQFERLWGAKIREARLNNRAIILTTAIAAQAERILAEEK